MNDGIEDRDGMGMCVEPLEEAMALWAPFEQFIYRSAAEREGREDARSIAGDLDLTICSLRKWIRLALKGNPTILLLLFTPDDQLCIAAPLAGSYVVSSRKSSRAPPGSEAASDRRALPGRA